MTVHDPVTSSSSTAPRRHGRARAVATVAALCAVATTGALVAGTPAYASGGSAPPASREVQRQLDGLVRDAGFPGALATYEDARGRSRDYTAGVGNLETGARVPLDGQVRIGSNSKTFFAVALLQLVDEGTIDLDAPVETYLPGLVHGDGVDGSAITVRQLLQHTSGLPNYTAVMDHDFLSTRHHYVEPRELLDLALTQPGTPPGSRWDYSNTNYVVAGLIVQKVAGRPLAEVITDRVIEPLRLRDTYVPDRGEESLRERHPLGYHATEPGGELQDITVLDPAWAWAAGDIVSTPSDLNAFFVALMGGDAPAARAAGGDADDRRDPARAARHAVRARAHEHPVELRRGRLGTRRQHPRVRDRRRGGSGRPVRDRRGDRPAGGDRRPRACRRAPRARRRRGALRIVGRPRRWQHVGHGARPLRGGRRRGRRHRRRAGTRLDGR